MFAEAFLTGALFAAVAMPNLITQGGLMLWVLLAASPVARLVKVAVLNRERGREGVRESLEEAGLMEVPRLEEKLNVLATLAQIAPLMGFLGTILGYIRIFAR